MTNRLDDESGSGLDADYVLELGMRRKWVALLVFAAGVAAVVSFTVWLPDLYSARATVLIETQQVSPEFVRSAVSAGVESRIQRLQQELMSRERLANFVTLLNLYPDLREKGVGLDQIVERLRRNIQLDPIAVDQYAYGGNRIVAFAIGYRGRDPRIVAQVANLIASQYVEQNSEMREGQAVRTAEFLKQQLAAIKQELDGQDRRVSEFNLSHIGELPQQAAANLASLERLNTQLRLNGESQMRATDRRDRFERQLADAESTALAVPVATTGTVGSDQVAALKRQLDELRRRFTDQYPEVIRVRAELATLERQLAERAGTVATAAVADEPVDPRKRLLQAIGETETELEALKNEELALRRAIASYEQRVENGPKRDEELQALSRDYQATKERYDTMLKRYEEAQLASSLEQGQSVEQFRILDAATPPADPSAPNRPRFFLVGLVFSLGLAVAAVLFVEKMDTAFHSIDELRAFVSVPALFSIPRVITSHHTRQQWRRAALTAVSVVVGLVLIVAGSRYVARDNERIARVIARGQL